MEEPGPAHEETAHGRRRAESPIDSLRNDAPVARTHQDQVSSSCPVWCQSRANGWSGPGEEVPVAVCRPKGEGAFDEMGATQAVCVLRAKTPTVGH